MSAHIVDHETIASFIKIIGQVEGSENLWGLAVLKRDYLHAVTKEAFLLSVRPLLLNTEEAHVFLSGSSFLYIVWRGKQKKTFLELRQFTGATLIRSEFVVDPAKVVKYHDLHIHKNMVMDALKQSMPIKSNPAEEDVFPDTLDAFETEKLQHSESEGLALKKSKEQIDLFQEIRSQKSQRKQLSILVVEDQHFSQKLLCEILRGVRAPNNSAVPTIDVATGIHAAWKSFLKHAPDIAFIDLVLADGSGHTLARAIKEIDPQTRVIIVSANNHEVEMEVARQNNCDTFITKPYNKKQILDCVADYIATGTRSNKGYLNGKNR